MKKKCHSENWISSKNSYGFEVYGVIGSFKRWFNSNTSWTTPIEDDLKRIKIAQENLDYESAFNYAQIAAKEFGFYFRVFTEEDWNRNNPIKKFFKKIFK